MVDFFGEPRGVFSFRFLGEQMALASAYLEKRKKEKERKTEKEKENNQGYACVKT